MHKEAISFEYEVYESVQELKIADATLLQQARAITVNALNRIVSFSRGSGTVKKWGNSNWHQPRKCCLPSGHLCRTGVDECGSSIASE